MIEVNNTEYRILVSSQTKLALLEAAYLEMPSYMFADLCAVIFGKKEEKNNA